MQLTPDLLQAPATKHRLPPPLRFLNFDKWERQAEAAAAARATAPAAAAPGSSSSSSEQAVAAPVGLALDQLLEDLYIARYDDLNLQRRCIADRSRMLCYQAALAAAAPLLAGKTLLDVGCGLGLTSMMAAKAGAKRVIGVEASAAAAALARAAVKANQLSGSVQVVSGRVEALGAQQLPQVGAILSDWLGPFLLGGGMLQSVVHARDTYLAPGGLMFPDRASIYLAGVEDRAHLAAEKQLWVDAFGFDLRAALPPLMKQPRTTTLLRATQVLTDVATLNTFDLYTVSSANLSWKRPFKLTAKREERLTGLMAYFDAAFTCRGQLGDSTPPVVFSTAPSSPSTQFKQLVFDFPRAIPLLKGDVLEGTLACKPSAASSASGSSRRDLDIEIEIRFKGVVAMVVYQLKADQM